MTTLPDAGGALGRALRQVAVVVMTGVMAVAGLIFVICMLAVGLVAGTALLLWALLRGKRPQGIRFGMPPGAGRFGPRGQWQAPSPGQARRASPPRGEVIDIEAREIEPRGPNSP